MSEQVSDGNGGRLIACRACGNRVARGARRCPACGAREPTSAAGEAPEVTEEAPPRAARRQLGPWPGLVASALVGGATAALVSILLRPAPAPLEQRPAPPPSVEPRSGPPASVPAPEPARETAPAPPAVATPSPSPGPSRSRGRTDWIFFFKSGDRLARMGDDAEIGLVIRLEKVHAFPDGTAGPAYLVQVPEGGQRFMDADELERTARIQ
jgi:hypothetical protein